LCCGCGVSITNTGEVVITVLTLSGGLAFSLSFLLDPPFFRSLSFLLFFSLFFSLSPFFYRTSWAWLEILEALIERIK